jgi:hypothetical protein
LDRLVRELPELPHLAYIRADARRTALSQTWTPPNPGEVLELVRDANRRIVRSGEELTQVVTESLRRYEDRLQSGTPISFTLWDTIREGGETKHRPKREDEFSSAIKDHLENDLKTRGIIANREVELNLGRDYTDIHVEVFSEDERNSINRIRLVIEVKGCWHREVQTAMQKQLREKYLASPDYRFGIYLVGWFLCDAWDVNDHRNQEALRQMPSTIADAQTQFVAQANGLTRDGVSISALVINASLRE